MDAAAWASLLNVVGLAALVFIGLRRWHGWAIFTATNLCWIAYSVVYDQSLLDQVLNVAYVAVSAYFAYAWRKSPPGTTNKLGDH